jgi:hypothetical protein
MGRVAEGWFHAHMSIFMRVQNAVWMSKLAIWIRGFRGLVTCCYYLLNHLANLLQNDHGNDGIPAVGDSPHFWNESPFQTIRQTVNHEFRLKFYAPQVKILDGRTNVWERIFEVLFEWGELPKTLAYT